MRCLVVDPSPAIRRGVLLALRQFENIEPLTSGDPLAMLPAVEPPLDLAVIGWSLEDDRGLELVRSLRAQTGLDSVPIVVVSARSTHEDLRAAREAGATDYVLRPFTPESLTERFARLVDPPAEQQAA